MSRLPLLLPLSDPVPVVVVATAVVFRLHLERKTCHGDKYVDRGRVNIVDVDRGL